MLPAGAEGPLPVFVYPAHPTWAPSGQELFLRPVDEPHAVLVLHGFDVLYTALGERRYLRAVRRPAALERRIARLWDAALADALARYPLDPDRLVCVGVSAAGDQCWVAGQLLPRRFAGLWVVSSGWHPRRERDVLANLRDTPVRIQHGGADPLVPGAWVRDAIAGLEDVGAPHEVVWIEGGGHGGHDDTVWRDGYAWALRQRRDPDPQEVHLARGWGGPKEVAWLRVPGWWPVEVDARQEGERVEITTSRPAPIEVEVPAGRTRTVSVNVQAIDTRHLAVRSRLSIVQAIDTRHLADRSRLSIVQAIDTRHLADRSRLSIVQAIDTRHLAVRSRLSIVQAIDTRHLADRSRLSIVQAIDTRHLAVRSRLSIVPPAIPTLSSIRCSPSPRSSGATTVRPPGRS